MRHIVVCGLPDSTIIYHIILCDKRYDFRKKKVPEQKMCAWISSTILSEIFLILRTNERDMIKNVYW